MMYMQSDTMNPENIISSQTVVDSGERKDNRLTDFSGDLTYSKLMPRKILPWTLKRNLLSIQLVRARHLPKSRKGIVKSTTCSRS